MTSWRMSSQTSARRRNYGALVVVDVILLLLLSSAVVAKVGVECNTNEASPDLSAVDKLRSILRNQDYCIPTNGVESRCTTLAEIDGAKASLCRTALLFPRNCALIEEVIARIEEVCKRDIGGTTRSSGDYWFEPDLPLFDDYYVALW